jgi:hypothetical protein
VIDDGGEPLPVGVPGELCVAGTPVAVGYLSGVERSASAFGPDALRPGGRQYRTGDLARLQADGTFEYLGRIDDQVKIRGVRVEPAEVELALRQHPKVHQAIVTTTGDLTHRSLVGHVVPTDANINFGELASHLGEYLPSAMIPASWVVHDSLPHTIGGKIDRRALQDQPVSTPRSRIREEPGELSEIERELQTLWGSVLNQPSIGVTDDFFALGGHSLLGVRLIARVADRFAVELPLRAIFDAPTVRDMAVLIASG